MLIGLRVVVVVRPTYFPISKFSSRNSSFSENINDIGIAL